MQINQLPTIPQAPANADVLAIEVGGVTYKISKSTLASAILGTIDSAPTQSSANLVKSGGVYNAISQSTAIKTVTANITAAATSYKDINITVNDSVSHNIAGFMIEGTTSVVIMGVRFNTNTNIMVRVRTVSGGTVSDGGTVIVNYT